VELLPVLSNRFRPRAVRFLLLASVMLFAGAISSANGQSRRKVEEPPPEPLPAISDETARCSFAYYDALSRFRDGSLKQLVAFDKLSRVAEPGLPGRWLFWVKTGKNGGKLPPPERVCAENVIRNGRERCVRWDTKPADPVRIALALAQPTPEELTVLRTLDGFVTDRAAALEFGTNGRQFATLQRVSTEISTYTAQPRHPALCNGVPEMMDFQTGNLAGLRKRGEDVALQAAKAAGLARQRVIALRDLRTAELKAAAAESKEGEGATSPAPPIALPAPQVALAARPGARELLVSALDGLLAPAQLKTVADEPVLFTALQRARDLLSSADGSSPVSPALRASAVAALRMIEAAMYSDLQILRIKQFQGVFGGSIDQIRGAHRATCTCEN
jgi:hypothetical protein